MNGPNCGSDEFLHITSGQYTLKYVPAGAMARNTGLNRNLFRPVFFMGR